MVYFLPCSNQLTPFVPEIAWLSETIIWWYFLQSASSIINFSESGASFYSSIIATACLVQNNDTLLTKSSNQNSFIASKNKRDCNKELCISQNRVSQKTYLKKIVRQTSAQKARSCLASSAHGQPATRHSPSPLSLWAPRSQFLPQQRKHPAAVGPGNFC